MKKRVLTLLLAALFLLGALGSCSQQTENAADEGVTADAANPSPTAEDPAQIEEDEPEIVSDDLPERDYGGFSFNIYTRSNTTHYAFLTEELNGEVLNDAIYERNLKIAERFNVVFTETEYSDEAMAQNNVQSGDDTFSLMNVRCTAADTMAKKRLCFDISTFQYIDLSKPYWDDELTRMIGIGDRQFTAIGSADLTVIDFMNVLLFNKNLHEQYQMEDFYTLVREGKWTFDRFGEYAAAATQDIDGDGTYGKNDQWGVLGVAKYLHCTFLPAGGAMYISKDADNYPAFTMGTDEHFLAVFEKIFSVLNDNNAWYKTTDDSNEATAYHNMFRNNQGLFMATIFYYIESLRDMDYDFGIVPFPKFDEAQENYYGRISFFDTSVIPVTVPDSEMSSIVFEALTCESFNSVIPAYKDVALKSKFARDEDSSDMIDVILEHRIIDFGDSYFQGTIRDGFVAGMFVNDNHDLASAVKTRTKSTEKTLDKMITAYEEGE
ncbi:MAG: hypothetical protein IKZ41_03865 [Clostridia bacterium]|nr:hypothetical protein [Clostridia bacterium]MBR5366058.1 hypothetical protein [Clostridia bacterium]